LWYEILSFQIGTSVPVFVEAMFQWLLIIRWPTREISINFRGLMALMVRRKRVLMVRCFDGFDGTDVCV
jgi:hypothetical protein